MGGQGRGIRQDEDQGGLFKELDIDSPQGEVFSFRPRPKDRAEGIIDELSVGPEGGDPFLNPGGTLLGCRLQRIRRGL
jgi:hypothetical protein